MKTGLGIGLLCIMIFAGMFLYSSVQVEPVADAVEIESDGATITGICGRCGLVEPWAETAKIRFCPGHEDDVTVTWDSNDLAAGAIETTWDTLYPTKDFYEGEAFYSNMELVPVAREDGKLMYLARKHDPRTETSN